MPVLKFMLAGDSGVGKTSLLLRFADDKFSPSFMTTIGIDFKLRNVVLSDKTKVRLQIWDTAGQERFRTITTAYYRGAMAIAIIYDVTDLASFQNIGYWLDQVDKLTEGVPNPPYRVLVGNKTDIQDKRCVKRADAEAVAASRECAYAETSACTAEGVEQLFVSMAQTVWDRQHQPLPEMVPTPVVKLEEAETKPKESKKCC